MYKYRWLNSVVLAILLLLSNLFFSYAFDNILLSILLNVLLLVFFIIYQVTAEYFLKKWIIKKHLDLKKELYQLEKGNFEGLQIAAIKNIANLFNIHQENAKQVNSYISHELKNQLAITLVMIESNCDTNEIIEQILKINKSINDIQTLSAVEGIELNEELDLALLCAEIIDEYKIKYENITFDFDSVPTIKGKRFLLYSVISNVIDNAIKYGNNKEIIVKVHGVTNGVNISVIDHGIGMSDQIINETFKANKQFNLQKENSYGIGLNLVKNVVELMNGFVWVESKDNEYTKIILSFPL